MRRLPLAALAGVAVIALLLLGGAYLYYFSGLRSAPRPLTLTRHSPSATAGAGNPASSPVPNLVGSWTVATGSEARYRVREVFAGQTSPHDAVARTLAVSGGLNVSGLPGALQATAIRVVAGLGGLQSIDQVAGFNVTNRDRIVSRTLDVQQYPDAVFQADTLPLPAGIEGGQMVSGSVPGRLTIHGMTRDVTAQLQYQATAGVVEVTGSIATDMTAFGITPPSVPFTTVDPGVTIEFHLLLKPA